nr:multicopper oxidase domain-containing protein [Arthrobacter sp. 24S4-2]
MLNSRYSPAAGTDFAQPGKLCSSHGRLQARLEETPGQVQLGGAQASALAYNGGVPGPTLRAQTGDVLNVELVKRLAVPTNLHVHGLHVSPQGKTKLIGIPSGVYELPYTCKREPARATADKPWSPMGGPLQRPGIRPMPENSGRPKYPMGYTDQTIHLCKGATRCAVR